MAVSLDNINTAEIIIQNWDKDNVKNNICLTGPNSATLITPTELHI